MFSRISSVQSKLSRTNRCLSSLSGIYIPQWRRCCDVVVCRQRFFLRKLQLIINNVSLPVLPFTIVPFLFQVAKIDIGYAKTAKKMDVKRLQARMWDILAAPAKDESTEPEITEEDHEDPNKTQVGTCILYNQIQYIWEILTAPSVDSHCSHSDWKNWRPFSSQEKVRGFW